MFTIDCRTRPPLHRRRSAPADPVRSLELRGVTVTDDDGRTLLDGADLAIAPGATVCVVGSTPGDQEALAAVVLGLERPSSGSVRLGGRVPGNHDAVSVRAGLAVVPREPWIAPGTVADNIAFDQPDATRPAVAIAARRVGLDDLIERLPGGLDAPATDLSLGERRRIALARAVLANAGLLVVEEPTTDLDIDEERRVARAIDAARRGRSTLLLTHRLSLARRADTVLVIDRGRLVPYRAGETGPRRGPVTDHSRLWDTRVPPLVEPDPRLRVVGRNERRPDQPDRSSWGITIGEEMVPGHIASGLVSRTAVTETWVAWSIEREEPVRIKVPRRTPQGPVPADDPVSYRAWEQLRREHRLATRLNHPGLSDGFGADLDAEMPYAVFEYLDSVSLARSLQDAGGAMEPIDVLYTGFELAGVAHYLHMRDHVHLDLRSRHVRTRGDAIVVTDLASCRSIGAPLPDRPVPVRGRRPGPRPDRHLVAPEVEPGRPADPAMDVYALGVLLHRATTGLLTPPPGAGPDGTAGAGPSGFAPYARVAPSAPAAMAETIDRMLAPDPRDRPEAGEVLSRFRQILPRKLVRPTVTVVATRSRRLRLVGAQN